MDTGPRFHEVAWAPHRSGLVYVAISTKLQEDEIAYIIGDSGAQVLFVDANLAPLAERLMAVTPGHKPPPVGGRPYPRPRGPEPLRDAEPVTPVPNETSGIDMLYSSGTTGRPKGIKARMERSAIDAEHPILQDDAGRSTASREDSVYLSPAPIYHGAPLRWTMGLMRAGATCVLMERFDPEWTLELSRGSTGSPTPSSSRPCSSACSSFHKRSAANMTSARCNMSSTAPHPAPVEDQAAADRVDRPDRPRILRRLRSARPDLARQPGMAHPSRLGRQAGVRDHPHPRRRRQRAGRPARRGRSGSRARAGSRISWDPAKTAAATNARGWRA